jgi:release factor glutamine methyltransferase
MKNQVYAYSEDSRLMGDALNALAPGASFLEIGVGNGKNLEIAVSKFNRVVATDIIPLNEIKKNNPSVELVVADRATCFRPSSFDVIAFNPPYLPSTEIIDATIDGGPNGVEVPLEFLESAFGAIKKNGRILVLLSSASKLPLFQEFCEKHSLLMRKVKERKLFFELLQVFEISKDDELQFG